MNGDLVRRALELWNADGFTEEFFAQFARPDAVLDLSANVLNPGRFEGLDGFRRFEKQVAEAWAEFRMEPQEVLERGDVVVVLVRAVGKGRESGLEVADSVALVCEMRDGLIASMRIEPDRDAALALVGR